VTSVEHNASRIGAEVLRRGGNAIDAAVATAYALAVTHPSAGNIGGGGFMVVRLHGGEAHVIDFRETAPTGMTTEKVLTMLDKDGAIGYRSAGVPGSVAGLNIARERYGTRPLAELLAPAIALAKKGHKLGARQGLVLSWQWPKLKNDPAARAIWGRGGAGKEPLREGDLVKQPDLARTLEAIAKDGDKAFYEGAIAEKIARAMREHGGYITADDLKAYKAKQRVPLAFSYRGFDVLTMPPPSMGGVAFAQIMLTLERMKAYEHPAGSAAGLHLFIEAARRAYSERRLVGGDPDFLPADQTEPKMAELLSAAHLELRKPPIDRSRATPSTEITASLDATSHESPQTTHLSVVDAAGNAVSLTTTQSAAFGSKIVIPGTGVLLGNALGGFSEKGVNEVAPGKRMASSMSPTIVVQNGKLALVLGSPGGDTIPNTVSQVFRNLVDHHMTIDEAVFYGRLHHQYLPDKVRIEKLKAPAKPVLDELARLGHVIQLDAMPIGDANDILIEPDGTAWGCADTREGGKAVGVDKLEPALARSP
jgi:gamma-glutamyltranspeptidase / glutathione hydrolase